MTGIYYREAAGALLVYDVTRPSTFEAVPKWKADLDDHLSSEGNMLPVVLLANKSDLNSNVSKEFLDSFCKEHGFIGWFLTSAKDDTNISEACEKLISVILKPDEDQVQPATIRLKEEPPPQQRCTC
eukprot:TRINITY_DN6322_c0_g2_i2.p1 TRINITY_DN6322_c0_g2~~TRINITY_DN6322_c0_g2_i2.p1  ORF type:complete len:127 (-),score=30.43 TRINITY_DN6322_c0_g2_i2:78-458(-)